MNLRMWKWLKPDSVRKIFKFVGATALRHLSLGLLAGFALSGVELVLAGCIQLFLITIGLLNASTAQIPGWVPHFTLAQVLGILCGLGMIRAFLQWVNIFLSTASMELQGLMQRQRVLRWAFQNQNTAGAAMNTLLGCCTYAGLVVSSLQAIAAPLITSIFLWLILMWNAPLITAAVTVFFFFVGLAMRRLDRRITRAAAVFTTVNERQNRLVFRSIKNLLLIHLYGIQDREMNQANQNAEELASQVLVYQSMTAVKYALPQALGVIIVCGITYAAHETGGIPAVKLLSYFYLFNRFVQALAEVVRQAASIKFFWPHLAILAKWWADHAEDGVRGRVRAKKHDGQPFRTPVGWKLMDVGFTYPESSQAVLKDLSLIVDPGEAIVIQGPSGVGKSTLLQLLLGSIPPTKGSVSLVLQDGSALSLEQGKSSLLKSIGYVGPESFLIEGTVLENLTYGLNHPVTGAQIAEALTMAECQFIEELPLGLEHRLTEQGEGLSAGQKQRMSLARALLRNPTVLVLDEATANLDFTTEAKLVKTLERLKGKMTIVVATHREALLRIADQQLSLGCE